MENIDEQLSLCVSDWLNSQFSNFDMQKQHIPMFSYATIYKTVLDFALLQNRNIEQLKQENKKQRDQIAYLDEENKENESEAREVNIRFDKLLRKYMKSKEFIAEFINWFNQADKDIKLDHDFIVQAEKFIKDTKNPE